MKFIKDFNNDTNILYLANDIYKYLDFIYSMNIGTREINQINEKIKKYS